MMEAVRTSETSVDNHFTRQYIPEDNSEQKKHYFTTNLESLRMIYFFVSTSLSCRMRYLCDLLVSGFLVFHSRLHSSRSPVFILHSLPQFGRRWTMGRGGYSRILPSMPTALLLTRCHMRWSGGRWSYSCCSWCRCCCCRRLVFHLIKWCVCIYTHWFSFLGLCLVKRNKTHHWNNLGLRRDIQYFEF
jgi:hypothetical protein